MPLTTLLPALAGSLFVIALAGLALRVPESPAAAALVSSRSGWWLPALLSLGFLAFSLHTVLHEGSLGFWIEHTRNLWGNQIWLDLLLAAGIAWFLMLPQARAQGMRLLPWMALILATGSIGLLAMLARLLYLKTRSEQS